MAVTKSIGERIYLKGKESFIVGTLLVFITIIFILPVTIFFILRYIYKLVFSTKREKVNNLAVNTAAVNTRQ